ncbi:MAG: hypothetical protein JSS81_25540 [Acidobacteria bacterium]|nr:hypothetical protein [Acidobacteriota bacterium]
MKKFLLLFLSLGTVAFVIAGVFAFINYLTGWHLGFKGEAVPGDPVMGVLFLVLAGVFGGLSRWMERKNAAPEPKKAD